MSDRGEDFNLHVAKSKEPKINQLLTMLRNKGVIQGYMIHLIKKNMADIIRTEVTGLNEALTLAETIQQTQEKTMEDAFKIYTEQIKMNAGTLFDDDGIIANLSKKTGEPKNLLRADFQKRYKELKK